MTRTGGIVATCLVALLLLLAAYLGGAAGLLVAATIASVSALLVIRRRLIRPTPHRRTRTADPAVPRSVTAFPSYRRLENALQRSTESARYFDHAVRPLLQRITATALIERHDIDLHKEPAAASALLGPELWRLIDPSRPASDDSQAPGVDHATLVQLLDRLETR